MTIFSSSYQRRAPTVPWVAILSIRQMTGPAKFRQLEGTNSAAPRTLGRTPNQRPTLRSRHPATRPRTRPWKGHVLRPSRGSQCGGCQRLGPPLAPRARCGRSCTHSCFSQSQSSPRDTRQRSLGGAEARARELAVQPWWDA